MSSELANWLRLAFIPGLGTVSQRKLLSAFGSPSSIFASRPQWEKIISHKLAGNFSEHKIEAQVEEALVWGQQSGNHILTLADAEYPASLLDLEDAPTLIYLKGNLQLLTKPCIAIVGSRNATVAGIDITKEFSRAISEAGFAVVSGLALGCDTAAHLGALQSEGGTIAVLGTGADRIYPAANEKLAHTIADRGLLMTEYMLGTPPLAQNFPRRNRLIAALSQGVLVVEAAEVSGSLITARLGGELGREVFAIPGSISSPMSRGCHRLIRDGAKLVETVQDIFEELKSH